MSAALDNLSTTPLSGRYACVDLETTGADPLFARIIEIGIVLIDDGVIIERWDSLVDPERPISERIQEVTGITNEMVRGAPTFVQLLDEVRERLRDRVFAAHNARFDHGFLRAEFARVGRVFEAPSLCTVKLARRLDPEIRQHNLDAVIERYGLTCSVRHRALPDALAVADFLLAAAATHGGERLREEVDRQLKPVALPAHLPASLLDELPDGPGAYRFLDAHGEVIFIGRALHVRAGVLSQLSATRNAKAMQIRDRVAQVQWQRASGEWSAHLFELLWRQRWQPHERFTLHLRDRGAGAVVRPVSAECLEDCFGEFRTEALAIRVLRQLARQQQVCLRLLGLEAGDGSCIAHQVNQCRGACVGKESRVAHDLRVQMAFADQAFRPWPFAGRVGFTDARGATGALHVFDRWCYIGSANSDDELAELADTHVIPTFDSRIYRLTLNALEHNRIRVRPLAVLN